MSDLVRQRPLPGVLRDDEPRLVRGMDCAPARRGRRLIHEIGDDITLRDVVEVLKQLELIFRDPFRGVTFPDSGIFQQRQIQRLLGTLFDAEIIPFVHGTCVRQQQGIRRLGDQEFRVNANATGDCHAHLTGLVMSTPNDTERPRALDQQFQIKHLLARIPSDKIAAFTEDGVRKRTRETKFLLQLVGSFAILAGSVHAQAPTVTKELAHKDYQYGSEKSPVAQLEEFYEGHRWDAFQTDALDLLGKMARQVPDLAKHLGDIKEWGGPHSLDQNRPQLRWSLLG